jgi:acyl-coenzyme A synthetase/AMP-(fatty) acid ligase/DNA-binding NarL/FixJ family response regulator
MQSKHKVLVVDDDPYILMSLEFLMKKSGYQVMIARNGSEAINAVNTYMPDLILLDIMMPDVDGYAICNYIKQTETLKHCIVVFLSAKTKEADIKKGYELGASLYISKPFSTKFLMREVGQLLEGSVVKVKPEYDIEYKKSIALPVEYWQEQAKKIQWFEFPKTILSKNEEGLFRWYEDGTLNVSYLCLDYHIEKGRGEQTALIYDSPVTKTIRKYNFIELRDEVAKFAGGLQHLGITKGDTIVIYMPMIPQAMIAMLACARIGAIHSVVFGGFAPHELSIRINDAEPKAIITASYGIEFDKKIAYKPLVDHAIMEAFHKPAHVIVYQREGLSAEMNEERDVDMQELMLSATPAACVPVLATDPLYILYTSGTTGKPKGIVRDSGGYAVALKYSMDHIYNVQAGEVFWAASDIGWVVGHSYIIYGPLIQGCTTILFEGKPVRTPNAGEFWRVAAEHQVRAMFTAPTAIRAIKKEDPDGELLKNKNLSNLKTLFLAGERCDPATYHWVSDLLKISVIDHWWQTESGWPMLGMMKGIDQSPTKAGSAGKPICGFDVQILEDDGSNIFADHEEGYIAVKLPMPPGCLLTLWKNDDWFKESYLYRFPGYYLTGDGGHKDEEGYFSIMGRIDDVINVSGHRLSTGEMEEIISHHPAIAECAVIGIADELRGQRPIGLIVMKDNHHNEEAELENELIQLVRDQIGAVAYFRNALLVKRLPKTRSGKILRKTMRMIADGAPHTVPSTIDDPLILEELKEKLTQRKIGIAFQ